MGNFRFLDPSQPQTLVSAVVLSYLNGALLLLFGGAPYFFIGGLIGFLVVKAIPLLQIAGGFGIANERRWGYWVAVAGAGAYLVDLLMTVLLGSAGAFFGISALLSLLFAGLLVFLLLHPVSREYRHIWFH